MSRFIELTITGGGKTIINLDTIESIVDCGSLGTSIYFKERSEDVAESYEQVKALLDGDINAGCKSDNDIDAPVTASMIHKAKKICQETHCEECRYRGDRLLCTSFLIADYINGQLKGEHR